MNTMKISKALANCIKKCNTCAIGCIEMESGNMAQCIKTDLICAEICATTLQLLQLKAENIDTLLEYCIEVCENCKETCEKHDHDHCKECAKACGECIAACEDYLAK